MLPVKRRLTAMFFPERCAYCGRPIPAGTGRCLACAGELPVIAPPVCPHCGRGKTVCICGGMEGPLDGTAAPLYYEDEVRSGILQFKKGCRPYAAEEYARMMELVVRREYGESRFDGITAVPSGRAAMKRRGFNPAQAIAEELAKRLGLPVLPLLVKVQESPAPQKRLSASQRRGNVLGLFDVEGHRDLSGMRLLLVDDVITTGATIAECAKMLKLCGAQRVTGAVVAATRLSNRQKYRIINKRRVSGLD